MESTLAATSDGNLGLLSVVTRVHRPLTVLDHDTLGKVTDDDNLFLHFPQVFSFDKTRELPGLDNRSGLYQAKVQILQQRICMGTCNSCQPIRNEA